MKRKNCFYSLLFVISLIISAPASAINIYVAANGSDNNSGTLKQPYLSLKKARDRAREIRANEKETDVTIYLRSGYYPLSETLIFKKEDSGSKNMPLIIKTYKQEKAHIIGGREIKGFKAVNKNSPAYKRIPQNSRKNVLQIDLKKLGITDYGQLSARGFGRKIQPSGLQLYFAGQPMTLARWPNEGWALTEKVPQELDHKGFVYSGDRPARWENADDIWMHGYWKWDWADCYVRIASIDTKKKIIMTEAPYTSYPLDSGKRFYALNLLEELDAPGEWYLDRKSGILYFWPPADLKSGRTFISLLRDPLIKIEESRNIIFENLIFEYTCGGAVKMMDGVENIFQNCTFRNIGAVAVTIGDTQALPGDKLVNNGHGGGTKNGVVKCEIYNCGEGGIILGGGDRKTLTPGNNYAVNNRIHNCSQWVRTYRAGIFMFGVGNRALHNEIYNLPHTAIFFWGNDHLMEYNEIHHVCMETGDAGAFYIGRDWSQRGHVIRFNYFHHLHGVEGTKGFTDVMAIYLDDWASGITVYGNLFYKAGRSIMIGGGRDNFVENNIIIDGSPAIHVDARGLGWAKYYFNGKNTTLFDRLAAVHPQEPPYSLRYPRLVPLLEDEPVLPKGNHIIRNISYRGKWIDLLNGVDDKLVVFKDNLINEDPGFIDLENGDFRIKEDSPVFKLGFKRLPLERIGIEK